MRTIISCSTLVLLAAVVLNPAHAADEYNTAPGLTAAGAPLGLHGIDPVAFLNLENRIPGRAEFTGKHEGVAYYFATEANLDAFNANPGRYIPQNGGFCTYGVSVGKKFDGDPRYAAVVDGRLYVFLNEEIYQAFQKDRGGVIARAAGNWEKIRHTAATEL